MNNIAADTRSVIVERDIAHPPEKIWRALTQPHLIQEWLMKSDFQPAVNHQFRFTADWGSVDCKVLTIETGKTLSYTWAAMGLDSVVTWTLTAVDGGTHGFAIDGMSGILLHSQYELLLRSGLRVRQKTTA